MPAACPFYTPPHDAQDSELRLRRRRELALRDALAHRGRRAHAARDGLHEVVHVIGATPL